MDIGITPDVLDRARAEGKGYAESQLRLNESAEMVAGSSGWLDNSPAMLGAALSGIRHGLWVMAGFLILNGVLGILLGGGISADEIRSLLLISSSIGFAVAGYSSANRFAVGRKLTLLVTCFILYIVWMVVSLFIFASLEQVPQGQGSEIILGVLGGLILVAVGGLTGAMIQAAVVTGTVRLMGRFSGRGQPAKQHAQPERDTYPDLLITSVPEAAHRIRCPKCGAAMADSDSMCVWCGYKTDGHAPH